MCTIVVARPYSTCLRDVVESVGRALATYQVSFALASAKVAGSW